ncbi:phage portal protein [Kitasatospora cineracea]|uniref:SPP1 Gp6-like portal protein n=1 Tax=Kitasatospora cineracea TaxID=88074 RepID=A0A3N4R9L4_9ACTN|nr:phage portal protein [Kitasatospora cineracea]RPE27291.1 SPP1 Gp6-like portal protein [Kitasatospora cineracea]
MLRDAAPEDWRDYLIKAHDAELLQLNLLNAYYEGTQPLSYLAPELLAELNERMRQVVINWPQLVVDSLEERLDVEGFRYARAEQTADDIWDMWQANDLDEGSQQGHVDSIALGRAYTITGPDEADDDMPVITVESPLDVFTAADPRTRHTAAGIKRWEEPGFAGEQPTKYTNLYLPNARFTYVRVKGKWQEDTDLRWEHNLGDALVQVLANRPRIKRPLGTSEMSSVLPLSDAANKQASDMMVAAEYHAMPRRWATGMAREDFADADGNPLGSFSALAGRLWVNESTDVKFGQFPEASLTNFHDSIRLLAQLVASLSGLPPAYLGLTTDNPPSADGIRSAETRLVKRAERRQRGLGGPWERTMRSALRVRDGEVSPEARRLETVWRDPATPTYAQKADAVVKLHGAGLLPTEQAWEDLGYSAEQRSRMRRMQQDALDRAMGDDYAAGYGPKPPADGPEPAPGPAPDGPAPAADPQPAAA